MGTTDPQLALTALEILGQEGLEYAMLHGRERLLEGDVSDVDLVVGPDPDEIIATTKATFASRGLFPVVAARYDLGGASSVWYVSEDASEAVQLDLFHDIEGLGHLGLRSGAILAFVLQDRFPPTISEEAQLVYLWRKRVWKRQIQKLEELRRAAANLPADRVIGASTGITGSDRTAREIFGRRPLPAWIQRASHPVLRARRVGRRISVPAGFWLHVPSGDLAAQVAEAFDRFLPHSKIGEVPRSRLARRRWFWGSVQPVRLRPGVFVSYGPQSGRPRPDLVVAGRASARDARIAGVKAMTARL